MTPMSARLIALVLLLMQGVIACAAGQPAIILAPCGSCTDHHHDDEHGPGSSDHDDEHARHIRLFPWDAAPSADEHCTPMCCSCVHIHLQTLESPGTPHASKTAREAVPAPTPAEIPAPPVETSVGKDGRPSRRALCELAPQRPPGLATIRLLI